MELLTWLQCSGHYPCRPCITARARTCTYNHGERQAKRQKTEPLSTPARARSQPHGGQKAIQLTTDQPGADVACQPSQHQHFKRLIPPPRRLNNVAYQKGHSEIPPTIIETSLQPTRDLGRILQCFFDEMEAFYPCIDRGDYYTRVATMFLDGYRSRGLQRQHISLAALTCTMAAIGVYLGGESQPRDADEDYIKSSQEWFYESQRLLNSLEPLPDLDLLRLHLLRVLYMTILQRRADLPKAMSAAVDVAFAVGLNDESSWGHLSARERDHRRLLWWTLCFMDCRLALANTRRIKIQHSDFAVSAPTSTALDLFTDPDEHRGFDFKAGLQDWPMPSNRTQVWLDYVCFCVQFTQLVLFSWEKVFSLKATKGVQNPELLAEAEISLLHLRKSIPASLLWDVLSLPGSLDLGDQDRTFRLKLIVHEVRESFHPQIFQGAQTANKEISPSTCYVYTFVAGHPTSLQPRLCELLPPHPARNPSPRTS